MIDRSEILLKLEEMKGRLKDLSVSDKLFIESVHETILRYPFTRTNCGDCYRDAVIQMYTFLQKNEIMKKSNYLLVAGVILQMPSDPNVYSNKNLTDEVAERYLKDNPNRISLFASYPEDWEERIDKPKKEEPLSEDDSLQLSEDEQKLVDLIVEKLKEKQSKTSIKEELKSYEIEPGKPIKQTELLSYLKIADSIVALEN